jgi:hypothetical protein
MYGYPPSPLLEPQHPQHIGKYESELRSDPQQSRNKAATKGQQHPTQMSRANETSTAPKTATNRTGVRGLSLVPKYRTQLHRSAMSFSGSRKAPSFDSTASNDTLPLLPAPTGLSIPLSNLRQSQHPTLGRRADGPEPCNGLRLCAFP